MQWQHKLYSHFYLVLKFSFLYLLIFLFKQNPFANSTYAIKGYPVKLFITVKQNVVVHHGFKNERMFYHLSHDVGVRPSQLCIDGS